MIFTDKKKREELNKLTNAQIIPKIEKLAKEKVKKQDVIKEAPLLFEMGLDKICDIKIGVIANKETCIERICQRDRIDKESANARVITQKDENYFKINCDYVITNEELNEDTKVQIEKILYGSNLSNETIIQVKKQEVEFLQFREFLKYTDKLEHLYTLKPLNFNLKDEESIKDEYKKVCKVVNLSSRSIFKPIQTHSENIMRITRQKSGIHREEFKDTDGLVTNKTGKVLALTYADCICLFFYDPEKNVIANVHSGWKGTYRQIAKRAIRKLRMEYKSKPENLICRNCTKYM